MVLFQKWPFIELFFLRQDRPGKCFLCYSRTKKRLLSYKNKKFEKSKNWHFSKVVNPWFWSKNSHFSKFFFTRYSPEKCLSWYSRSKKSRSRQKKNKFKQSKHWHFSEGVNPWFWSKNSYFSNFFFTQYTPEKCLLWYSRTKKSPSRLYKKQVQKVKSWHFSERVNPWFWCKNDHYSNFFF